MVYNELIEVDSGAGSPSRPSRSETQGQSRAALFKSLYRAGVVYPESSS